ncbi:MAG: peptidylprolyl cis-trans isomerase lipoprotein PpiC-type [Acidobacteria bacterium]|nr:peptidylprolyl cis-trans isomerase lipoprotein PpiC-type [Acidobacteriota bacterium]
MKRFSTTMLFLALALPMAAQNAAPAAPASTSPGSRPVAAINGEVITADKLNALWATVSPARREQYEKNGGKSAFLDNYLRKRLLVQEALKSGFDKRADVQADIEAAKESVLFDRYVRDVVSPQIVTDAEVLKFYEENKKDYETPEQLRIRHIVILPNGAGPRPKSKEQAIELIKRVAMELNVATLHNANDEMGLRATSRAFEAAAKQYSEDGAAADGGDLGYVGKGQLDPTFETTAWSLPIGKISGVVETPFGYHLILVEDKRAAGVQPFDVAGPKIREGIIAARSAEIVEAVTKLTNELRNASKISVYPENIR